MGKRARRLRSDGGTRNRAWPSPISDGAALRLATYRGDGVFYARQADEDNALQRALARLHLLTRRPRPRRTRRRSPRRGRRAGRSAAAQLALRHAKPRWMPSIQARRGRPRPGALPRGARRRWRRGDDALVCFGGGVAARLSRSIVAVRGRAPARRLTVEKSTRNQHGATATSAAFFRRCYRACRSPQEAASRNPETTARGGLACPIPSAEQGSFLGLTS